MKPWQEQTMLTVALALATGFTGGVVVAWLRDLWRNRRR